MGKLKLKNKFNITVQYQKRKYSYNVKHWYQDGEEEVFNIITNQKTVVLMSNRLLSINKGCLDHKQFYRYNEQEITNKCLMNRVIEAIDQYTRKSR